jgi:hypothetical protein
MMALADFDFEGRRIIMKNLVIGVLAVGLASVVALEASARIRKESDLKLAHMVFFTVKDHSKEMRDKLVASCTKHLSGHEGCVSFSVGTRAEDADEPVSVKDFDVALHLVFANRGGKLKYLKSPRHGQFVEENRPLFDKVRVFDSYLVQD